MISCEIAPAYAFLKNPPSDPQPDRFGMRAPYDRFVSMYLYQPRRTQMFSKLLCGVTFAALCVSAALPISAASADGLSTDKVTLVFDHTLPNVPGKSMKGVLVEYPPGGSSPAHTHPDSSFIYATVLEGAIRSKVNDGPEKVYHAGENFAEVPGDHHGVSANASDTQPARLLAVFVVNTDEKNLTTNDKE
jgi:quercetin dioxygenase-like cupin family protein